MFDHYLKYDELTAFLHILVEKHSAIAAMESIGKPMKTATSG